LWWCSLLRLLLRWIDIILLVVAVIVVVVVVWRRRIVGGLHGVKRRGQLGAWKHHHCGVFCASAGASSGPQCVVAAATIENKRQ